MLADVSVKIFGPSGFSMGRRQACRGRNKWRFCSSLRYESHRLRLQLTVCQDLQKMH